MAADRLTPVDETGMPLPLAPTGLSPFEKTNTDWHHHFHPRRSELLEGVGGMAVRNSRLQLTHKTQHVQYHQRYSGPPIPETETGQFSLVVLATAGYVPPFAIDYRKRKGPRVVKINDKQRERLWQSGEISSGSPSIVRTFLGEYAVKQDLSDVNDSLIDEFLYTPDLERRRYLGHWLLAQAIEHATEPVTPVYKSARRAGLLNPVLPPQPTGLVQKVLGSPARREQYIHQLADRLAA